MRQSTSIHLRQQNEAQRHTHGQLGHHWVCSLTSTNSLSPNASSGRNDTDNHRTTGGNTDNCGGLRSIKVDGTVSKDHLAFSWVRCH